MPFAVRITRPGLYMPTHGLLLVYVVQFTWCTRTRTLFAAHSPALAFMLSLADDDQVALRMDAGAADQRFGEAHRERLPLGPLFHAVSPDHQEVRFASLRLAGNNTAPGRSSAS